MYSYYVQHCCTTCTMQIQLLDLSTVQLLLLVYKEELVLCTVVNRFQWQWQFGAHLITKRDNFYVVSLKYYSELNSVRELLVI